MTLHRHDKKRTVRGALIAVTTAAALTLTSPVVAENKRVGDFSLLDQAGYFHHMAWYDNHKAIAFLVHGVDEPDTQAALNSYSEMKAAYEDQGILFMMINPLGEDRDAVASDVASLGIDMPVLIDDVQVVSEDMGVEHFGHLRPRSIHCALSW